MSTYFSKYSCSYSEWLYYIFFCIRNLTRSIFDTQPVVPKSFFRALSSWWSILYFCIIENPLSAFIYAGKATTWVFGPQNIDFLRYILIVLVRPGFLMALEKQMCIKHVFKPIYTYLIGETTVYEESDLSTKLGYVSLELPDKNHTELHSNSFPAFLLCRTQISQGQWKGDLTFQCKTEWDLGTRLRFLVSPSHIVVH